MPLETISVEPAAVRGVGREVAGVGAGLNAEVVKARKSLDAPASVGGWAAVRASRALDRIWDTYLSGLGETVEDYGDRLRKVADAYERTDREAAEALGVVLPAERPVGRGRPDRVPR